MPFLPGLHVFNKGGRPLGVIDPGRFTISATPMFLINDVGSMELHVARRQNEVRFLQLDRIVVVGDVTGIQPWAGTIDEIQFSEGLVQVTCTGILEQLGNANITIDEELTDTTLASSVYRRLLDAANVEKGRWDELQFTLEASGTAKYPADLKVETDGLSAIMDAAALSRTEFTARSWIGTDGWLKTALVVRDKFDAGTGMDLTDDVNNGNVSADIRWSTEAPPIRNAIKLTGAATNISQYVPEWARWAVHEFEPIALAETDPGDYRRRVEDEATVDWGLSRAEQRRLANLTMNRLWLMYGSFLRSVHDMDGQPWHPGWDFGGLPERERTMHTGYGWRTHGALAQLNSQPLAVVMRSRPQKQIAGLLYDRVAGVQTFRRFFDTQAADVTTVTRMSINGTTNVYTVQGGVITGRTEKTFVARQAYVTPYTVTYMWPGNGKGEPEQVPLRRVLKLQNNSGNIQEDDYFPMTQPHLPSTGSPYIRFNEIKLTDDIDIESSYIGKQYDFERQRIGEWDPRRDGIGQHLRRRTVWQNQVTSRLRWHAVPWDPGKGGKATLIHGVSATDVTSWPVDTLWDMPTPPYNATVGTGNAIEQIRVYGHVGRGLLQVRRAQGGTNAIIHEVGTEIQANIEQEFDGFVFDYHWPSGEALADQMLADLMNPAVQVSCEVVNRNGLWRDIQLGRRHHLLLSTEGRPGGTDMYVRVIGYAPDQANGSMELLLEQVP